MITRRGIITGLTTLIAAPAIVRAESLDAVLRGYNLDPLVPAFMGPAGWIHSQYVPGLLVLGLPKSRVFDVMKRVNSYEYGWVRESESFKPINSGFVYPGMRWFADQVGVKVEENSP